MLYLIANHIRVESINNLNVLRQHKKENFRMIHLTRKLINYNRILIRTLSRSLLYYYPVFRFIPKVHFIRMHNKEKRLFLGIPDHYIFHLLFVALGVTD